MIIDHQEFWYLATPYSKYPYGTQKAYEHACQQAEVLVRHNIPIFCPISMSHGVQKVAEMDWTHDVALSADMPFLNLSTGLIVCQLPGWDESYGVDFEIEHAIKNRKAIIYMTPFVPPSSLVDYYKLT